MRGVNCGSGQRPFTSTPEVKWVNIDSQERWNPDLVADGSRLDGFPDGLFDYFVLHHVLEHFGCGEGKGLIDEAYRILKPGGSLLVFVPDLRALAQRWLAGGLTTQIYVTNLMGAFMGSEEDRHKWGFDAQSLEQTLTSFSGNAHWGRVKLFDWRTIPGADIAKDWWIIGLECVK